MRLTATSRLSPADEKAARQLRELQVKMDDFEKVKLIGRGAYGEVQLVSPGNLSCLQFLVFCFGFNKVNHKVGRLPKVSPLGNNGGDH